MLFEECRAFGRDGNDIWCNLSLQIVINLKDDIPVQRTYTSIPKYGGDFRFSEGYLLYTIP